MIWPDKWEAKLLKKRNILLIRILSRPDYLFVVHWDGERPWLSDSIKISKITGLKYNGNGRIRMFHIWTVAADIERKTVTPLVGILTSDKKILKKLLEYLYENGFVSVPPTTWKICS